MPLWDHTKLLAIPQCFLPPPKKKNNNWLPQQRSLSDRKLNVSLIIPINVSIYHPRKFGEDRPAEDRGGIRQCCDPFRLSVCLSVSCSQLNNGVIQGYGYYRTLIGSTAGSRTHPEPYTYLSKCLSYNQAIFYFHVLAAVKIQRPILMRQYTSLISVSSLGQKGRSVMLAVVH